MPTLKPETSRWFALSGLPSVLALACCPAPASSAPTWLEGLEGFATTDAWGQNGTTGGLGGPTVRVRTADDLIRYISSDGPLVIEVEGTIELPTDGVEAGKPTYGMHFIRSHKTILGVGEHPTIRAGGFGLGPFLFDDNVTAPPEDAIKNVIIRNLTFDGTGGVLSESDGINIFMFSHHIWVDHCTFINSQDGAVDVKRGSSFITISNNLFIDQIQACLLGHTDVGEAQDAGHLKVSYHHNWFRNGWNRMPLVRFATPHLYNNYYDNVGWNAVGLGTQCSVFSEHNHFTPDPTNASQQIADATFFHLFLDDGALLDQGSVGGHSYAPERVHWRPADYYDYALDPAEEVPAIVMANAGAGP